MVELSFLNKKASRLSGLDISSSSVKMLELSGGDGGSYRLERYAIESLPRESVTDGNITNLEAVSEAVRRVKRRMGGGIKEVAVALPKSAVITKKIILPEALREYEMEIQVEAEANQYIPFPLEEVNLDFQVIGPAPLSQGDVEVLIAASRKEKVEDRVAVGEAAGLKTVVVDVESLAAEAAFALVSRNMPQISGNVVALVDIGATAMSVIMLRDGVQIFARDQAFGGNQLTQDIVRSLDMSLEEAETAKRTGGLPDGYENELIRSFMDNLALEISRSLQFFFTSTKYNEVRYIVLSGGCAVIPGLVDIVKARTQTETIVANPFASMKLSSKVRAKNLQVDAPSLMVACGLALRRFDS